MRGGVGGAWGVGRGRGAAPSSADCEELFFAPSRPNPGWSMERNVVAAEAGCWLLGGLLRCCGRCPSCVCVAKKDTILYSS